MNDEERNSIGQLYASLSTDDLLAIIRERAEQYSPEALMLAKSELCKRNVNPETAQSSFSDLQKVSIQDKQGDAKPIPRKFKWSRVVVITLVLVFMYLANAGIIITDAFALWLMMFCGLKIPPPPQMGIKYWELLLGFSIFPLICIGASCGWLIMMRSRWLILLAIPSMLIHLGWIWMLWDFIFHGKLDVPFKLFMVLTRLKNIF
jgi:hypothetical protein